MPTPNANPVFNRFRPFWQPNSQASSPSADDTRLERLSQKLDAAEKKIIEYAQLSRFSVFCQSSLFTIEYATLASLYAEQKRYQDIICHSCRENISRTSLATAPQPTSSGYSQSTSHLIRAALVSTIVNPFRDPRQIGTTAAPPLPSAPFLQAHDRSPLSQPVRSHSPAVPGNNDLDGLNFATSECSPNNPQATVPSPLTTTTAAISPYSADADSAPPQLAVASTSEKSTKVDRMKRDWTVEYNSEIKRTLNLNVANTFTFTARVFCVKFSRDGKYLAVGLRNGEIHIHNMMTGSQSILIERSATVFYTEEAGSPSEIWAIRFSLDNKYIATGGSNGQINIWEIGRRRIRAIFKHTHFVRSVDFSPNGRFLVSASYDKSLCMWRVRDGSRRIMSQGTSFFVSVAFSPDGRSVAAGNDDGLLMIWDARTSQLVVKCEIADFATFKMRSMAFTPDGTGIASGSNTLRCWNVSCLAASHSGRQMIKDDTTSQMNQIWEFKGHKHSITAVSFSSDNLWAISSSLDGSVCILDARTGSRVCTLKGHLDDIWGADFSPDGYYITYYGSTRFLYYLLGQYLHCNTQPPNEHEIVIYHSTYIRRTFI